MPEYLKPKDILDLYGPSHGGALAVKARLADDLRSGRLGARASKIWISDDPLLRKARNERLHLSDFDQTEIIEPGQWRGLTSHWEKDQRHWDWDNGLFHVTISRDPVERILMWGVEFPADGLHKLFAPSASSILPTKKKNEGGRPPKPQWDKFWLLLLDMQRAGQLRPDSFSSRAKLYEHITDTLSGDLGQSTIREKMEGIYDRIIR